MSAASDGVANGADLHVQPIEADRSLGELFARLGDDLGQLVSTQVELARKEISEEAKDAGRVAGLFGVGSLIAYLALTLFCFAAAWGLSEVVPEGVAFLIVGAVVAVVAAVLMLLGRSRLEAAKKVAPETVETLKEDVQWTRQQVR